MFCFDKSGGLTIGPRGIAGAHRTRQLSILCPYFTCHSNRYFIRLVCLLTTPITEFASDIAEIHPASTVTLLHSRNRLLPRFDEGMHSESESLCFINVRSAAAASVGAHEYSHSRRPNARLINSPLPRTPCSGRSWPHLRRDVNRHVLVSGRSEADPCTEWIPFPEPPGSLKMAEGEPFSSARTVNSEYLRRLPQYVRLDAVTRRAVELLVAT